MAMSPDSEVGPFETSRFLRLMLHLHMDRDPLLPLQVPSLTVVWDELPSLSSLASKDDIFKSLIP